MATDSKGGVGLLITQRTITAVQARIAHGRVEVVARGSIATPQGAMDGAAVADATAIGQALRSLMRQLNLRVREVRVALLSPGYSMRSLRLPDVIGGERRALVRGELEETGTIPFGADAFDFLWAPAPAEPGRRQADSFVYYTSDLTADGIRDALRIAGLQLERLEPASLAQMRACLGSMPLAPMALLCPNRKYTDLCIFDGKHVRSVRRIASGWEDFTRPPIEEPASPSPTVSPLSGWPLLGEPEAETGVVNSPSPSPAPTPNNFLTSEVARSLAFYAREFPDAARPQSVYLLGPEIAINSMKGPLTATLPLSVRAESLLASFDMPTAIALSHVEDEDYLTAIGAAIGDANSPMPALNLAIQGVASKTRRQAPVVLFAGMAGSTAWMVLSVAAAFGLTFLESGLTKEIGLIDHEIQTIKDQRAPLLRQHEIASAARTAQAAVQAPASSALGRIAAATTPGVALTTVLVTRDGKIVIDGTASNPETMQRFAAALGQGRVIRSPQFELMRQDAQQGLTFRIASVYRAPKPVEKPAEKK